MTEPVPDPAYAPAPVIECMAADCTEDATTHLIIINGPDEHQVPLCSVHHIEYSQPGHLRHLKHLAGIDEEKLHGRSGDQDQDQAGTGEHPALREPDGIEPGAEVVPAAESVSKPKREPVERESDSGESASPDPSLQPDEPSGSAT